MESDSRQTSCVVQGGSHPENEQDRPESRYSQQQLYVPSLV